MAANLLAVGFIKIVLHQFLVGFLWLNHGTGSIRRWVISLSAMVFAPLVGRIVQNRDLVRREQWLDFDDRGVTVWLQPRPHSLQLFAGGPNLPRILRFPRLAIRLLRGINPRLIGDPVLLAGGGKVILDRLQVRLLFV